MSLLEGLSSSQITDVAAETVLETAIRGVLVENIVWLGMYLIAILTIGWTMQDILNQAKKSGKDIVDFAYLVIWFAIVVLAVYGVHYIPEHIRNIRVPELEALRLLGVIP